MQSNIMSGIKLPSVIADCTALQSSGALRDVISRKITLQFSYTHTYACTSQKYKIGLTV